MDIGLISDTHGLLRAQALDALRGCERILHAGDIGAPEILDVLRAVAPVYAVRGNNDRGAWAQALPEALTVEVAGLRLHLLHDRKALRQDAAAAGFAAVVAGHSHRPLVETRGGVLYVNPGSAGPQRFALPITVARLRCAEGRVSAQIIALMPPRAPG